MVCIGRKAQVLARRGMDIWRGNHPSGRRAFSAVLTRLAYASPGPGRRSVWTSPSQLRPFTWCRLFSTLQWFRTTRSSPLGPYRRELRPVSRYQRSRLISPAAVSTVSFSTITPYHHHPLPRPGETQFLPDILRQAQLQAVGRHAHHHQGIAFGVRGLPGPPAVHRGAQLPVRCHPGHPSAQGRPATASREPRPGCGDGGGVGRPVPDKPQGLLERAP